MWTRISEFQVNEKPCLKTMRWTLKKKTSAVAFCLRVHMHPHTRVTLRREHVQAQKKENWGLDKS